MAEQQGQTLPRSLISVALADAREQHGQPVPNGDPVVLVNVANHSEENDHTLVNGRPLIAMITADQRNWQAELGRPAATEELETQGSGPTVGPVYVGITPAAETATWEDPHGVSSSFRTGDTGNSDDAELDVSPADTAPRPLGSMGALFEGFDHPSGPPRPFTVRSTSLHWHRYYGFNPNEKYYTFGPEMPCVTRVTPSDRPSDKARVYDSSVDSSNYWPTIERHIANPTGRNLRVFCPICAKSELVIDLLQPPNVMVIQEDPHVLTPCRHVIGYHC